MHQQCDPATEGRSLLASPSFPRRKERTPMIQVWCFPTTSDSAPPPSTDAGRHQPRPKRPKCTDRNLFCTDAHSRTTHGAHEPCNTHSSLARASTLMQRAWPAAPAKAAAQQCLFLGERSRAGARGCGARSTHVPVGETRCRRELIQKITASELQHAPFAVGGPVAKGIQMSQLDPGKEYPRLRAEDVYRPK